MKGYLSRIAKQSGLRFPTGTVKERRSSIAEPANKHLSPIEFDETILIDPSHPDQSAKRKRQTPRSKITNEPQTKAQAPKRNGKVDQLNVVPNPVALSDNTEKKLEINETKFITTAPPANVSSTHVQTTSSTDDAKDFAGTSVLERMTGKEVESPTEVTERGFVEAKELNKSSEKNIAHDVTKNDYFIKTAEFIERGDVEPAEIRQILFREIQQWAADSPVEAEASETAVEKTEAQITKQIVRPHFEQTESIREQVVNERAETNGLAEQTFELSIGTINVVIEDEKPKQPEPAPRATNQNTSQPAQREYSRLSRHYL
jgi:hypothetical protein